MGNDDKGRLRELACTYAEYACGEPMAQRREKWRLHNRLEQKTVPFHIEDNGSFFRDLTPLLECEDGECRALEARLLHALTAYETIDDDRIIPDRFLVRWRTPVTDVCPVELDIRLVHRFLKPVVCHNRRHKPATLEPIVFLRSKRYHSQYMIAVYSFPFIINKERPVTITIERDSKIGTG